MKYRKHLITCVEAPFAYDLHKTEKDIVTEATVPNSKIHEVYHRNKLLLVNKYEGYDIANMLPAIEVLGQRASRKRVESFPKVSKHAAETNNRFPIHHKNIEM